MTIRSRILVVTLGSMHQEAGGTSDYHEHDSILSQIPTEARTLLLNTRAKALTWLQQDKTAKWQGILISQHEWNKNLAYGRDFGGDDRRAQYRPALERFKGRFYKTLGTEGRGQISQTEHHILFVCGLYGLMTPLEPIQCYNCPVELSLGNFNIWTEDASLTKILLAYIKKHKIIRVFDFTATEPRRRLINWSAIHDELKDNVLHCFSRMVAGDAALIDFGELMKSFLLTASSEKLLSIEPETEEGDIVFRDVAQPRSDMPSEELLRIVQQAESELPLLEAHPLEFANEMLTSGRPTRIKEVRSSTYLPEDWLVSFTSEFQKSVFDMNDKKLQGRILEAVTKICKKPMEPHGDTIKPLSGKLAGKWRYRIGNYRLIYLPDEKKRTIFLLVIGPRGDIYDD